MHPRLIILHIRRFSVAKHILRLVFIHEHIHEVSVCIKIAILWENIMAPILYFLQYKTHFIAKP